MAAQKEEADFQKKESHPMEFIASRILKDSSLALGSLQSNLISGNQVEFKEVIDI